MSASGQRHIWIAPGLLLLVVLLTALVWHHRIERDEGYLAASSWLVARGLLPYRDFVFPQQPYFPLLYGALMRLTGPSLIAARALSAAFFLALSALISAVVVRHEHRAELGLFAGVLFFFNTLSLFWYPRCRQYALVDLLLFASFAWVVECQISPRLDRRVGIAVVAGFAAAAAACVRLLVGPAVVFLAFASGRSEGRGWSWRPTAAFVSGALLASGPCLGLLWLSPRRWLSDTVELQILLRPPFDPGMMWVRGGEVLGEFLSVPTLAALAVLALLGWRTTRREMGSMRPTRRLAWGLLIVLGASALLCHPTQAQYLLQTLPYLTVVAMSPLGWLLDRLRRRSSRFARVLSPLLVALAVVVGGQRAVRRVWSDHHHDPRLGVADLMAYQQFMSRHVRGEGGMLLTWWPGYLLVPEITFYPGSEMGRPTDRGVGRMSVAEYAERGLRHPEQIQSDLHLGVPRFVVIGVDAPPEATRLVESRYRLLATFGAIRVHERRENAPHPPRGSW